MLLILHLHKDYNCVSSHELTWSNNILIQVCFHDHADVTTNSERSPPRKKHDTNKQFHVPRTPVAFNQQATLYRDLSDTAGLPARPSKSPLPNSPPSREEKKNSLGKGRTSAKCGGASQFYNRCKNCLSRFCPSYKNQYHTYIAIFICWSKAKRRRRRRGKKNHRQSSYEGQSHVVHN